MQKNILIVSATTKEIEPFLEIVRKNSGLIAENTIDILISGIGMTSTTYHLAKQLIVKKPQLIIQAGVAGCFDNKIALGSVVAVKQDTIADESVVEMKKLRTLFDLQLVPQNKFPYTGGWLINKSDILSKIKLKKVKGVSVNQITSSKQMIGFYKNIFNPVVESMEGAALHYVALSENIPFLQIRSTSNYIGERNKKNWNMKESILNLNKELLRLLETI